MESKNIILDDMDAASKLLYLKDISMDEENLKRCVADVREWLKSRHIPDSFSDVYIENYLMRTKSVNITKERIENSFIQRHLFPEFWLPFDPLDDEYYKQMILKYIIMPKLTPDHHEITILSKFGNTAECTDSTQIAKLITMIVQTKFFERRLEMGVIYVMDMQGFSFKEISTLVRTSGKRISEAVQKQTPHKVKKMIFINVHSLLAPAFSTFKLFFSSKLQDRIVLHSEGTEILLKYAPKEVLPKEFGGTSYTVTEVEDYWRKKLIKHREWFLNESNHKIEEPYLSEILKSRQHTYELPGAFRKLDVD